ncbi:MAG: MoaD/ThiS family protein [Promethearchaeota archaeon]
MSSIKIEFLSILSEFIDRDELEIPIQNKISLDSLIEKMIEKYGDEFRNRILDDNGNLHKFILLAINGNQITSSDEMDILIQSGDEVSFIPAIAGG